MESETATETFERLRDEMQIGRPLYTMQREVAEHLNDEWFARRLINRVQFMNLIDAYGRMKAENAGTTGNTPLDPIWKQSNERLLAQRSGKGEEDHAHL